MYCLCVNVYCHRVSTQLQLTNISISISIVTVALTSVQWTVYFHGSTRSEQVSNVTWQNITSLSQQIDFSCSNFNDIMPLLFPLPNAHVQVQTAHFYNTAYVGLTTPYITLPHDTRIIGENCHPFPFEITSPPSPNLWLGNKLCKWRMAFPKDVRRKVKVKVTL
jgi:hypothetical protein